MSKNLKYFQRIQFVLNLQVVRSHFAKNHVLLDDWPFIFLDSMVCACGAAVEIRTVFLITRAALSLEKRSVLFLLPELTTCLLHF